jgi:hypothetical protein
MKYSSFDLSHAYLVIRAASQSVNSETLPSAAEQNFKPFY